MPGRDAALETRNRPSSHLNVPVQIEYRPLNTITLNQLLKAPLIIILILVIIVVAGGQGGAVVGGAAVLNGRGEGFAAGEGGGDVSDGVLVSLSGDVDLGVAYLYRHLNSLSGAHVRNRERALEGSHNAGIEQAKARSAEEEGLFCDR